MNVTNEPILCIVIGCLASFTLTLHCTLVCITVCSATAAEQCLPVVQGKFVRGLNLLELLDVLNSWKRDRVPSEVVGTFQFSLT